MNTLSKSFARLTKFALVVVLCGLASAANVNTLSSSATGSSLVLLLKNATDSTYFYAELGKTVSDLRSMAELQSDTPEKYSVIGDGVTGPLNEASIQSLNGYTNPNLAAYLAGNTSDAITWTIMGSKSAPQATAGAAAFAVTSNVNFMDTESFTGLWENQATWSAANFFGNNFITDELNNGSSAWTNGQSTTYGWGSATPNGVNAPVSFNGAGFENGAALGVSQPMYLLVTTGGDAANVYKSVATLTLGADGVLSVTGGQPSGYTVSGTVSGLGAGKSVVLQNNSGDDQTVTHPASGFSFSAQNDGSAYSVTVLAQPVGQSCLVNNGSGTLSGANVTNVAVTCTDTTYTVSGSISGLTASGLSLSLSGSKSDSVSPVSGATSYAFTQTVVNGESYTVTIGAQPTGQTCTLSPNPATGTVGTTNVVVNVTCILNIYTISGTNTNGASVSISGSSIGGQAGTTANPYNFTAKSGDTVTLTASKTGYTCSVANSPILVFATDVTNADVSCTPITYTISGTTDGATVTASGSTLSNTVTTGISTYSLSAKYGDLVTLTATKLGYSGCVIAGSPITVSGDTTANVSGCLINTYTISGTVSGLGSGKTLLLGQGTESKTINSNGGFSFATKVNYGAAYGVTVKTQPNGQTCLLTNASSNNVAADVTTISVICSDNAINVMSSAATGSSLVLLIKNSTDSTYFYTELSQTVSDLRTMAQLQSDTPEKYSVVGDDVTGPLNEANLQALSGYTNPNLAAYLAANTRDDITWTIMGSKSAPSYTAGAAAFAVTSNVDFLDQSPWFSGDAGTSANFFGNNFIVDELNNGDWTNGQSTTNGWGSTTPNGVLAPVSFNGAGYENGAAIGVAQSVYLLATTGGDAANIYKSQGKLTLGADGVLGYVFSITGTTDGASVTASGSSVSNTVTVMGGTYSLIVKSGDIVTLTATKTGYTCSVAGSPITVGAANVTTANVNCTLNTYLVGGTNADGASVTISGTTLTGQAATTANPYSFYANYGDVVTLIATKTGYTCSVADSPITVGAANVTSANVSCTVNTYSVGGTNADGASVSISGSSISGQAATSANPYSFNAKYGDVVTLTATKTGYTCSVSGSPILLGLSTVTTANVNCTQNTYTIGGTVSGLAGSVTLMLNNTEQKVITSNRVFRFSTQIAYQGTYEVKIAAQPVGQTCSLTNSSGSVDAINISNVVVTCSDVIYTITVTNTPAAAVSISGSTATNATNPNSAASFTLNAKYGDNVTLAATKTGNTCTVTPSSMSPINADSSATVSCSVISGYPFTVAGNVSGLASGKSIVLSLKSNNLTLSRLVRASNGTFLFTASVPAGNNYSVNIDIQPSGQVCTLLNASGTNINANVNNIAITCQAAYSISGVVSGLSVSGMVLRLNNGIYMPVAKDATSFKFGSGLISGSIYSVSIATQPAGKICTISNGVGVIGSSNISNVSVYCENTYTIGGSISGLTATGLVLNLNGSVTLPISSGSSVFKFGTGLKTGASYSVTINNQPTGRSCSVVNGNGVVAAANVVSISVVCN